MKLNLQLFASTWQEDEETTEGGGKSSTRGGSTSTTVTDNAAGKVDKDTIDKYNKYKKGYNPSQNVTSAKKYLEDILKKKPGAFQSDYKAQLDALYDRVTGREKFSYDMNEDVLYQQYKDMFVKSGQKAMQDTLGQATTLTGGYDNSYAQTAAQQTYNEYLGGLNDKIPEFYQMAYDRYQQEGDELYQQFSMASDMYGKDYSQYRDQMSDWQSDRDYAQGAYQGERDFDYDDFMNMLKLYQQEYWNQRHAVSKSTTEESHWSETEESSWSKRKKTSEGGTSGGSGGGSGSGGSGSKESSDSATKSVSTYEEANAYLKSVGKGDVFLRTRNEFYRSDELKAQFGTGKEGYINYLNYMCGL